ncbi:MAG: peptidase S8 [Candidatus Baltobacteraceae bacterium]
MNAFRRFLTLALVGSLAACGGSHSALPSASMAAAGRPGIVTMDNPSALPGDNPSALPGDNPSALPGDNPSALPGAQLGCDLTFAADRANCTIAINLNVPALADATAPASFIAGLHPADILSAYRLSGASGTGTVAIVDAYDDPAAEADLAVYRTAFGLTQCTSTTGCFTKIGQRGSSSPVPAPNAGWSEEISLDLDMVSAVCPNCRILLVETDSPSFDDLGAGVDTAVAHGARFVSNSYYGPEWSGETAYDAHYHHAGVAITVSSGDQRSPFYPAASPYVTAVGGTSLSRSAGAWTESAWAYDGAGCSKYESKPSWQNATGCKTRAAVDVAAVADPQTGVSMYDSAAGGWYVVGGTSVGAPVLAAAYALSGTPQGPAYSYAHRSPFNDIAPAGYDLPTGLGSPDGVAGL